MQKIQILWCQCIIWQNTVIINQKHQEVYGNIISLTTMGHMCPSISAGLFSVIDKNA